MSTIPERIAIENSLERIGWYVSPDKDRRWRIYHRATALPFEADFEPRWWFKREEALAYAKTHLDLIKSSR